MAKREKTVFRTDEIAHKWAHNIDRKNFRNAQGNFSVQGELLYSYRTVIARCIRGYKGDFENPVFLHLVEHFSNTTAKQQTNARRASYGNRIFYVTNLGLDWSGRADKLSPATHKANVAHYRAEILSLAVKWRRARAANKEWRFNTLAKEVEEGNRYIRTFCKQYKLFALPSEEEVKTIIDKAREDTRKRTLQQIENDKRHAENVARVAAERNAKILVDLPRWIAGESVTTDFHWVREATGRQTDYLRIEGTEVVTQRGARVPLHHVKRAIPLILRVLRSGGEWKRGENDVELRLADFRIEYVGNGGVSVGCHRFDTAEIERIAPLLATAPDAIV